MARKVWLDTPQLFNWIEREPGDWGSILFGQVPLPGALQALDTTEYLGPLPPGPTDWSEDLTLAQRNKHSSPPNSDVFGALIVTVVTPGGYRSCLINGGNLLYNLRTWTSCLLCFEASPVGSRARLRRTVARTCRP